MFSQPLDLGRFIRSRTDSKLEVVPILDILIIVLFFGIFSSAFVFPQGVEVDLELTEELVSGMEVTAVLTVRRDDMLLFEGQNLKLSQFKGKAVAFFEGERKGRFAGAARSLDSGPNRFRYFWTSQTSRIFPRAGGRGKSGHRSAHFSLRWENPGNRPVTGGG